MIALRAAMRRCRLLAPVLAAGALAASIAGPVSAQGTPAPAAPAPSGPTSVAGLRGPLPPLRVCADPNNLPFSNEKQEGFENRLAELVARGLGTTLEYVWRPQRRGFVRIGLTEGRCDIVMGVPVGFDPVRTTRPYYGSTYVFVYRADRGYRIASLADTLLRHVKIGVHLVGDDYHNPPPAQALAARGIVQNVKGYSIFGDYDQPNPPARLIEAVASGEVDVAIVWGPLAGYFAQRQSVPLSVVPVPAAGDVSGQQWTFPIAMGVRHRDIGLAQALDRVLAIEQPAVQKLLTDYGVPLVDAPTPAAGAAARAP
jgi:quinoprotein dehydrogenase-associated probable ABC transporter substrate-binding protein